jgi:hypothetical protein
MLTPEVSVKRSSNSLSQYGRLGDREVVERIARLGRGDIDIGVSFAVMVSPVAETFIVSILGPARDGQIRIGEAAAY